MTITVPKIETAPGWGNAASRPDNSNSIKPEVGSAIYQLLSGVLFAASAGICYTAKSTSIRNVSSGNGFRVRKVESNNEITPSL